MNILTQLHNQTMSSLEIAKLTGKQHKDVLETIRKILEEAEIQPAEFSARYKDAKGEERPCFNLPRRECDLIIAGYSVKYRLAIIDRWQSLEAQLLQTPLPEGLDFMQFCTIPRGTQAVRIPTMLHYYQFDGKKGIKEFNALAYKHNDLLVFETKNMSITIPDKRDVAVNVIGLCHDGNGIHWIVEGFPKPMVDWYVNVTRRDIAGYYLDVTDAMERAYYKHRDLIANYTHYLLA